MTAGPARHTTREELPIDPQRAPWDEGADLRPEYHQRLKELDEAFVGLGERVVGWAAALDVAPPVAGPTDEDLEVLGADVAGLEDAAFTTIAREAPVATDLRATVAMIRSIYDLLRAGQLVQHIAEALAELVSRDGELDAHRTATLQRSLRSAVAVFDGGIAAWRDRDALAAAELRELDDDVDALRDELFDLLPWDVSARGTVAYVLACRHIERLADHGVNLAVQATWSITGERVGPRRDLAGPTH